MGTSRLDKQPCHTSACVVPGTSEPPAKGSHGSSALLAPSDSSGLGCFEVTALSLQRPGPPCENPARVQSCYSEQHFRQETKTKTKLSISNVTTWFSRQY